MKLRHYLAMLAIAAGAGLALAPAAQAAVTENITIPIDSFQTTAVDLCDGDTIALTGGDAHLLMFYAIDGNHVYGTVHLNLQGVTGTDLTTGAKYQVGTDFDTNFVNSQVVLTGVLNEHWAGQGSAPNYLVHENAHRVLNANGTVTVNFDKLKARGPPQ
jgi:hypothetical protein